MWFREREDRNGLWWESAAVIFTFEAHIALDKLRECKQRLRAILVDAQEGRSIKHAFWESVSPIVWELYMSNPDRMLADVAQQLPE